MGDIMKEIISSSNKQNKNHDYENFYKKIREKVEKWAEKNSGSPLVELILILPDAVYLLIQMLKDERVDVDDKVKIGMAMAYIVSPIDLIPDFIAGIGQLDDLYVALWLIETLFLKYPEIVEELWPGDKKILQSIQTILERITKNIGTEKLDKLIKMFKSKFGGSPQSEASSPEG